MYHARVQTLPNGLMQCPGCGQMLVPSATQCQFCHADLRSVPRAAGMAQAGTSRWQQDTSTNWWSVAGYFVGVYWLGMAGLRVMALLGGDFIWGSLSILGSGFLAYAFFFRADVQNPVRIFSAIAIARDLMTLAFAFVFAPLNKYTGGGGVAMLVVFMAIMDIGVAGFSMFLSGEDRGLF